jgi:NAD(P)-dependent dehydrogenase (short-subunit alcohol dehydrogenase family)
VLLGDKVAIISGVGPGLGRQLALAYARHGASLLLGARQEARLAAVRAEVAALGGRAVAVPTDVTDPRQCERLAQTAIDEYGHLDVLVNNAAAASRAQPFEDADLDDWRQAAEVTLFGNLQMTHAAIPALRARGGGSILFVNSMIVRAPRPLDGAYATAKAALLTAAQALARELGPDRIRVNTIVPGWLWGPTVEHHLEAVASRTGSTVQEQYDELASHIPLGLPTDADCADAAVFFASDLSSVVTGQALDVNGGEVCH